MHTTHFCDLCLETKDIAKEVFMPAINEGYVRLCIDCYEKYTHWATKDLNEEV